MKSLMITIVASVYENVAGLPMKLVGIWLLFTGELVVKQPIR